MIKLEQIKNGSIKKHQLQVAVISGKLFGRIGLINVQKNKTIFIDEILKKMGEAVSLLFFFFCKSSKKIRMVFQV